MNYHRIRPILVVESYPLENIHHLGGLDINGLESMVKSPADVGENIRKYFSGLVIATLDKESIRVLEMAKNGGKYSLPSIVLLDEESSDLSSTARDLANVTIVKPLMGKKLIEYAVAVKNLFTSYKRE